MSDVQGAVPASHPLRKAWDAYKATEDFANSKKWATFPEHADGSLWAAYSRGWVDSGGPEPFITDARKIAQQIARAFYAGGDTGDLKAHRLEYKLMDKGFERPGGGLVEGSFARFLEELLNRYAPTQNLKDSP